MIKNHIIIRRPSGDATIFGSLAHRVLFRAAAELESLRQFLPPGRYVFSPQPKSGVIIDGTFCAEEWAVGPRIMTDEIRTEDLVIDVEVEHG